jgi:hypothetical protein
MIEPEPPECIGRWDGLKLGFELGLGFRCEVSETLRPAVDAFDVARLCVASTAGAAGAAAARGAGVREAGLLLNASRRTLNPERLRSVRDDTGSDACAAEPGLVESASACDGGGGGDGGICSKYGGASPRGSAWWVLRLWDVEELPSILEVSSTLTLTLILLLLLLMLGSKFWAFWTFWAFWLPRRACSGVSFWRRGVSFVATGMGG